MIGCAPVQTRISIMDSGPTKKIHPVATDCNRHPGFQRLVQSPGKIASVLHSSGGCKASPPGTCNPSGYGKHLDMRFCCVYKAVFHKFSDEVGDDVMGLNRRDFIARAALGMGALAASGVPELAADPYGLPIGIQLYTVRDHLEKDLAGTSSSLPKLDTRMWRSAGPSIFTGRSRRNS